MDLDQLRELAQPADTKTLLLVLDGLGGLPNRDGRTELEAARTPTLDKLAAEGICGLHEPVGPGITPGSGPGHLALFGYDPQRYMVGRGALAAAGIGADMSGDDVAARGNFCTIDDDGNVTDRRAGRIPTETNQKLCEKLNQIELPGVKVEVSTVKEHRFLILLRGEKLDARLHDTDPQRTGVPPLAVEPDHADAAPTAKLVQQFVAEARKRLADESPANMVLLRGFAHAPGWPRLTDVTGMRCAALAGYPMYWGLTRWLGFDVPDIGSKPADAFTALREKWAQYDFFYLHVKATDSRGEDGDFDAKVQAIEEADQLLAGALDLQPDVLVVTGDHSTPAAMASHSWHPVPVLLRAATARPDNVTRFGERDCIGGGLGPRLPGPALLPLMLSHAGRLTKYGA